MSTFEHIHNYSVKLLMQLPLGDEVMHNFSIDKQLKAMIPDLNDYSGRVFIHLHHIDSGALCRMKFLAVGTMICARCGKRIQKSIDGQTDEIYSFDPTEEDYPISSSLTIDLTQQCIDTCVSSIPTIALCRSDCLGLCSTCGVSLNDNPNHYQTYADHYNQSPIANRIKIR